MQETEAVVRLALQLAPIGERLRQHDEGSHHIGLDEGGGAVNRAVDMAFGGQMQNGVGTKSIERRPDRGAVANVGANKGIARTARRRRERRHIAGVGKLIQHEHFVVRLADRQRTTADPMKPAPPVTNNRMPTLFSQKWFQRRAKPYYDVCTKETVRRVRRAAACGSGVGPYAKRRHKLLIVFASAGAIFSAC